MLQPSNGQVKELFRRVRTRSEIRRVENLLVSAVGRVSEHVSVKVALAGETLAALGADMGSL